MSDSRPFEKTPRAVRVRLGEGLEAVYEWCFRLGPGFVVGVGNGLILGWLMYNLGWFPAAWRCSG